MNLRIHGLDADDDTALFHSTLRLSQRLVAESDPDMDPDTEPAFRATLRGNETFDHITIVAASDGEAVGLARVLVHEIEGNTDKAEVEIEVDADHRRRGVGTELLKACLDVCEERSRTNIIAYGRHNGASLGFWSAADAPLGQIERESRLWLADTDEAMMRDWVDRRLQRASAYELVSWRGDTPAELLGAAATLATAMNDAPLDDLDYDDDIWTEDDIVALDRYYAGRDVETWGSVVLAPDSSPAGLTVAHTLRHKPRFAGQGDTVVVDGHRNRGIGRWLKAHMWLRLRADAPAVEAIDTGNAESNDPMLAINVAMGFKPLAAWGVWQAGVSTIRAALADP